jgi:branched-subunit amino acid transport protein
MVWALIFGAAAITFLLRLSFLGALKPHQLTPRVRAPLRFVAPALFAAIVVPQVLMRDDAIALTSDNLRLLAALAAAVVAWFTRSTAWTILGGMSALWLLQWRF